VHLNHLGIPIRHDPFYPQVAHKAEDDFYAPLSLLAKHIQFIDPITQKSMNFSSQLELTL
jgi:tRNA pseudouridine32 synthase / 23S rRNA pseudouridine746 synthase